MKLFSFIFLLIVVSCNSNLREQARERYREDSIISNKKENIEKVRFLFSNYFNSNSKANQFYKVKLENEDLYFNQIWVTDFYKSRTCIYAYFTSKGILYMVSNYCGKDSLYHDKVLIKGQYDLILDRPVDTKRFIQKDLVTETSTYIENNNANINIASIAYSKKPVRVEFLGLIDTTFVYLTEEERKAFANTYFLYNEFTNYVASKLGVSTYDLLRGIE